MPWPFKLDRGHESLIAALRDEIKVLRQQHTNDVERVDRLMEALSRKANIDLVMPQPVPLVVERQHFPNPWKDPNQVTSNFNEETQ